MHTGARLGQALKTAMDLKKVRQRHVAAEFDIKQPSVSEWVKFGRIDKKHIPHLVQFFSDVVSFEHWGLPAAWNAQAHDDAPLAAREPSAPYVVERQTIVSAASAMATHLRGLDEITRDQVALLLSRLATRPEDAGRITEKLAQVLGESAPADAASSTKVMARAGRELHQPAPAAEVQGGPSRQEGKHLHLAADGGGLGLRKNRVQKDRGAAARINKPGKTK